MILSLASQLLNSGFEEAGSYIFEDGIVEVALVFNRPSAEDKLFSQDSGNNYNAMAYMLTTDCINIKQGTKMKVRGVDYTVVDLSDDGYGLTELRLR